LSAIIYGAQSPTTLSPRAMNRLRLGRPLGLIAKPNGRLARLCDYLGMVKSGELAGVT
jgi:hypothetical protein